MVEMMHRMSRLHVFPCPGMWASLLHDDDEAVETTETSSFDVVFGIPAVGSEELLISDLDSCGDLVLLCERYRLVP